MVEIYSETRAGVKNENHIKKLCELLSEELYEGGSSQLYTQLLQKSGLYGIQTLDNQCSKKLYDERIMNQFSNLLPVGLLA